MLFNISELFQNNHELFVNGMAGLANATVVTIVGHPVDTTKVYMQSYNYRSSFHCILDIYKRNGIGGFYRGALMPFVSHTVKRPIQYTILEEAKKYIDEHYHGIYDKINTKDQKLSFQKYGTNWLIGFVQAPIGSILGTPIQVLKIRTQTNPENLCHNFKSIIKNDGFKGFYRGFLATIAKDSLFGGFFIGNYYTMRDLYGSENRVQNFINGGVSHLFNWFLLIPIDHIKTNIQNKKGKTSIKTVIRNGMQKHGIRGFWRGVIPACIRTVPVSGFAMMAYEEVRNQLQK